MTNEGESIDQELCRGEVISKQVETRADKPYLIEVQDNASWLFLRGTAIDDSGNKVVKNLSLMVSDGTAPVIELVRTTVDNSTKYKEIHFFVFVSDNRGVKSVWIDYWIIEDKIISIEISNYLDTEYRGVLLLEEGEKNVNLHFVLKAEDESGNIATSDENQLLIYSNNEESQNINLQKIGWFILLLSVIILFLISSLIFIKRRFIIKTNDVEINSNILTSSDKLTFLPPHKINEQDLLRDDILENVK